MPLRACGEISAVDLKTALQTAIAKLEAHDVGSPRLNAETLLMFTLGCDRAYLYAHPERELSAYEAERYQSVIAERARGKLPLDKFERYDALRDRLQAERDGG